jgi:predicted DNA-binding protein (UPF0251 family)
MKETISQSQALGNLAKLLELKQISQEMHDYLVKQLTTPTVVEYDPENPDMVARTFEVQLSDEELEQIQTKNKKDMMSGSAIQFVGDSQHTDDFLRCLITTTKNFDYVLDFSQGDQTVILQKIHWGVSHSQYETWPQAVALSKEDVKVKLTFINKLADGVIQAEVSY